MLSLPIHEYSMFHFTVEAIYWLFYVIYWIFQLQISIQFFFIPFISFLRMSISCCDFLCFNLFQAYSLLLIEAFLLWLFLKYLPDNFNILSSQHCCVLIALFSFILGSFLFLVLEMIIYWNLEMRCIMLQNWIWIKFLI